VILIRAYFLLINYRTDTIGCQLLLKNATVELARASEAQQKSNTGRVSLMQNWFVAFHALRCYINTLILPQ
jgi:hypothetical protein